MPKYRKRQQPCEAVQWFPGVEVSWARVVEMPGGLYFVLFLLPESCQAQHHLLVPGDWLLHQDGCVVVMDDFVFQSLYERAPTHEIFLGGYLGEL